LWGTHRPKQILVEFQVALVYNKFFLHKMIKLFAHRGFVAGNILQNSLASFAAAQKNNFKAIEFDLWFLQKKFFLKHDSPTKNELKNLPQLEDYLTLKNQLFYWMDFKNLDEENAELALKIAKQKIEKAQINLSQIYFAPFILNHEIAANIFAKITKIFGAEANLVAVCQELKSDLDKKNLRQFLLKNRVKNLSIFHELIDENFIKIFNQVEIFAWTVNDLKRLRDLENLGVKNFATDKITPQIYDTKS
jgi:glycerophosphoryl diester phosphodiesterase